MDGKLQVIAGILALFFLGVAIAKSLIQRARKREEAARRIAASKESQEVSLHNPFAAGEGPAAGEPATPQGGRGKMEETATAQSEPGEMEDVADEDSKRTTASESGETESIYMWE